MRIATMASSFSSIPPYVLRSYKMIVNVRCIGTTSNRFLGAHEERTEIGDIRRLVREGAKGLLVFMTLPEKQRVERNIDSVMNARMDNPSFSARTPLPQARRFRPRQEKRR